MENFEVNFAIKTVIRYLSEPKESKKIAVILQVLASGKTLNRFDAERLGDHVLNTTISSLRKANIQIVDKWETVPGKTGKPCHCKRYAIKQTATNLERCLLLLRHWGYKSQPRLETQPKEAS